MRLRFSKPKRDDCEMRRNSKWDQYNIDQFKLKTLLKRYFNQLNARNVFIVINKKKKLTKS